MKLRTKNIKMSKKSPQILARIKKYQKTGSRFEAHYLGFFECFNEQAYYEAHDVLEELWLADRKASQANFYKGLIQFAGAFVHLQKNRLDPAFRLFLLAEQNFSLYPSRCHGIHLKSIRDLGKRWRTFLQESHFHHNPWSPQNAPQIDFPKDE